MENTSFDEELHRLTQQIIASENLPIQFDTSHPWVTGHLGNIHSNVMFLAESASLTQVEIAEKKCRKEGRVPTAWDQWNVSPADHLFREELKNANLLEEKESTLVDDWHCYITDLIKIVCRVKDFRAKRAQVQFDLGVRFSPVLQFEIDKIQPKVVAIMGPTILKETFEGLLKEGHIKLPEGTGHPYIWHYSYVARFPSKTQIQTQYKNQLNEIRKLSCSS